MKEEGTITKTTVGWTTYILEKPVEVKAGDTWVFGGDYIVFFRDGKEFARRKLRVE